MSRPPLVRWGTRLLVAGGIVLVAAALVSLVV